MKQNVKIFITILSSLFVGTMINSFAMSASNYYPTKIAVVDVPAVVEGSSEVNTLKESQKAKVTELKDFVTKAKADVDATKDSVQKKKLEDSYNKELKEKKDKMDKEYVAALSNIEKDISGVIAKKAKDENYQLVLTKGIVLYGGDDITSDIKKLIK
jgi:Skp family chaperone for outer membrane proteins